MSQFHNSHQLHNIQVHHLHHGQFSQKRVHNVEESILKSPSLHCSTEYSRENVLYSQIVPPLPTSKSDIFDLFGFDRRNQKFQSLRDCCHCPAPKATVGQSWVVLNCRAYKNSQSSQSYESGRWIHKWGSHRCVFVPSMQCILTGPGGKCGNGGYSSSREIHKLHVVPWMGYNLFLHM